MDEYRIKYKRLIEPLYGPRHEDPLSNDNDNDNSDNSDNNNNNEVPHAYSVEDRVDMTGYDTYSIDPEGCRDADDAFSIYTENDKLFLAIHIADPTEHINISSPVWTSITNKIVTRYPSNTKPIHMMPEAIMQKSSLMVNKYGNIKLAITIVTEIHTSTYEPIGNVRLLHTKIKVDATRALSYGVAGRLASTHSVLQQALKISEALKSIRGNKTKGIVLNDLEKSYVRYNENGEPYLYCDTPVEKSMKQMIAEFAIFANSFVGEYLKIHGNGLGLFRICNASEWLGTLYDGITGAELLNEIIVSGIRAEYISNVGSHDLVGSPEYCHFTSPIRRFSDCICHYLLKYIHLSLRQTKEPESTNSTSSITSPFTNEELEKYSNECARVSKLMKNVQYKDTKFRLIQTMYCMLLKNTSIRISYFVSSYTGLFLNLIIDGINEHSVYLSYTLRIPIQKMKKKYEIKKKEELAITRVNCMNEFDEGSIPELDAQWVHGS